MATMASLAKPSPAAGVALPTSKLLPKPGAQFRLVAMSRGVGVGVRGARLVVTRAAEGEQGLGSAADAGGNSVVLEVASLPEEPDTEGIGNVAAPVGAGKKKPGPLERGGSLSGEAAAGKAPSAATLGKTSPALSAGKFEDPRWKNGTWDISMFAVDGKTDWNAVIDAEVVRRKILESNPESSNNDDEVVFDTSIVPWWAWVKRFHLPEAELLNGRAAMIGYASGWLVDAATGVGLVDQQNSFFGKLLLFISVVGVLAIRKTSDVDTLRKLADESTFYDKQWQATWKDAKDREKSSGL
ncbi:hypothetical protein KC19_6G126900 [Ceratodon purpureus]|uniref:Uncharacterized protein n=1 Tax=Ceratodon purpureus TaxID=3225 RepID=A0A8T0HHV3_CERPU|nr:hypothetical protein KC19_6G126900 [Ceratodon purpureus]